MNDKNRNDLSYDVWGDLDLAHCYGNKATFYINPKYGEGKSLFFDSDLCIYPVLTQYCLNFKLKKKNIYYYKENSLFLGKILKGKLALKTKDSKGMLFNEGDLFCFSGNFVLNEKYHFNDNRPVVIIGAFGYHKDIVNAFKTRKWPIHLLKNFLENPDLEKGVILNKTHELDQCVNDLYFAMTHNDGFVSFLKSLELFYSFAKTINNKKHQKIKTYKQEQVSTVIEIKHFLDNNLDTYYAMPKLAEMFHISLSRMQSIFEDYYNVSPYKYHLNKRLEKANYLILNTDIKITEIATIVGFTSYDNFFKAYKNKYGCNPSKHKIT